MYQALDPSRREIRLIEVRHGHLDDEISCTFKVVSLSEAPIYDALSYAWGNESQRASVMLAGVATDVTISLRTALLHLRYPDRPRTIWADAVCIDQGNHSERASQVAQMGDIYRCAATVVAWLGDSSTDSDLAMAAMKILGAEEEQHWDPTLGTAIDAYYLTGATARSIADLLDRPWWHRLWTVQETILPSDITFLCGTTSLASKLLFGTAKNFQKHSTSCCQGLYRLESGLVVRTLNSCMMKLCMLDEYRQPSRPLNFIELVSMYRERQCTDPRDKVYGLLGLAQGDHAALMAPNYKITAQHAFEDATMQLIRRSAGLQILSLTIPTMPQVGAVVSRLSKTPSWVPDWSVEGSHLNYRDLHIRLERLVLYSVMGSRPLTTPSSLVHHGPGRLACRAAIIGQISKLGDARDSGENRGQNDILVSWRRMADVDSDANLMYHLVKAADFNASSPAALTSIPYSDAYWLTLCSSVSRALSPSQAVRIRDLEKYRKLHDAWWDWVANRGSAGSEAAEVCAQHVVALNDMAAFFTDISVSTGMRRFFLTQGDVGLMGLAPRNAQVGDSICLIEGGLVPFIVRNDRGSGLANAWSLIGDSYVHGIMDGEGLCLGNMTDIILV